MARPSNGVESSEAARQHAVCAAELAPALMACDFPLAVWAIDTGRVRMANDAAARMFAMTLAELVGKPVNELLLPSASVQRTVAALAGGFIDDVRSERRLRHTHGEGVAVTVWTRAIDLDDQRAGVSLVVPTAEVGRLGRDPAAPWRDLAPVAIGSADLNCRIVQVSADIEAIVGVPPSQVIGSSLCDLMHPDDAKAVFGGVPSAPTEAMSRCNVRLRRGDGWVDVCLLIAPIREHDAALVAFAIVGPPHPQTRAGDRVAELELRLRHIGAEVRAAGLLDGFESLPPTSAVPELAELTSRQWEILSRLTRGDRVATIASDLFVSQSTVRNHLTAIFKRFGVHSQSELLAKLRRP